MKNNSKNVSKESMKKDEVNEYLNRGVVDPSFKNGWHTIICTSARVFSTWILHEQKMVYDFEFTDKNTHREIWLSIVEDFEVEEFRLAMRTLFESFFNAPFHELPMKNLTINDFVMKKCKVLTKKYGYDAQIVKLSSLH